MRDREVKQHLATLAITHAASIMSTKLEREGGREGGRESSGGVALTGLCVSEVSDAAWAPSDCAGARRGTAICAGSAIMPRLREEKGKKGNRAPLYRGGWPRSPQGARHGRETTLHRDRPTDRPPARSLSHQSQLSVKITLHSPPFSQLPSSLCSFTHHSPPNR